MPKLIILIGLLAMSNSFTAWQASKYMRTYTPPETAAKAAQWDNMMRVATMISPERIK